jgi:OOP family OmpA-OmpF porin
MKITRGLYGLSLISALIVMAGCASSQPKLTQEQVLDQYPQVANLNSEVKDARAKGSELLAPESYATANKSLIEAMNAAHNNKKDAASEAATEGLKVIDKMKKDTSTSRQLLSEALSARDQAMKAGVATLQGKKLAELDDDLKKTSTLIEDGNIEKAKQRRPELIAGYSQLELDALKQGTADRAKSAIATAKQQGAEKYAPKTIAQAEEEMVLAEKILDADRTQTVKADVQANKAKWLAEQSAVITETVKDFNRRDYTLEDVVLWHQAQLSIVNEPIGGQLPFNQSGDAAVLSLKNSIDKLKNAEVNYSEQLAATEKERLASEAKDRAVKKQFETVQAMFTKTEANVYLQRQDVLISAHGFQFPSGVSEIQTANFPLMNKIIRAIEIFPNARIEVSGHTDSTGADNINKSLSQARAEKVGKFLSEVGEISSKRITTVGYGESRPLATNKTAAGRAENRRVEIRIINQ